MDQEFGPISSDELRERVRKGGITPDTLVKMQGSNDWRTADHIRGLFASYDQQLSELPVHATARQSKASQPPRVPTSSSNTTGTPPTAIDTSASRLGGGKVDRLLHSVFAGAKYISVAVILISLVVIALCLIFLVMTMPKTEEIPDGFVSPTLADFEEEISRAGAVSKSTEDADDVPLAMISPFSVARDELIAKYPAIRRQLGIIFDHFENTRVQVDLEHFTTQFSRFLMQAHKKWESNYSQFARAAVWFAQNYLNAAESHVVRIASIERENEINRNIASARRITLATVFATALASTLAFLVLPLLIEIEQNTRKSGRREV
jgi:hypothetical protein